MTKRLILFLAILSLVGCASIPLGTMWRMMNFTPQDFVALDPAELGVAIKLPDALALDDELVTFDVELYRGEGKDATLLLRESAQLESVEKGRRTITPLPPADPGRHWHVLRLPAGSHSAFRNFQNEFDRLWQQEDNSGSFRINVNPKFVNQDSLTGAHEITIALRFMQTDGWFDLVRDATFDFDEIRRRRDEQSD